LKNVKLKSKIIFLSGFIILAFVFLILFYIVPVVNKTIDNQTENKMKSMVETAYNLTDNYYMQFKDGKIDEQTAKSLAADAIKNMRYDSNKTGYFWINDYDGLMIMHPTKPELVNTNVLNMADSNGFKPFTAFVNIVNAKGEGTVHYNWPKPGFLKSQPKISYVKGFEAWKWVIGSGVYISDLQALKQNLEIKMFIASLIIMILSILIIMLIIKPLNKNLKIIELHVKKLMNYDLSGVLALEQSDEIGVISKAVGMMTTDLRDLVLKIKEDEVKSSNNLIEIDNSLDIIRINSEQISCTTEELAKGAMEQATSTGNGSDKINNIVNELDAIAIDINNNRTLTQNTTDLVLECENSLNLQAIKMKENKISSENAVETVTKLSDKSHEIGEILVAIKNIAEQTNLLALNAAIEAARAGEMGRGFAVVADEVRKLAEESGTSVKNISEMINDIQISISKTVSEMNGTKHNINDGENALAETIKVFSAISNAVREIAKNTETIAASSSEIKGNAMIMADDITNIASISQETAAGAEELASTSHEETNQIQNITMTTKGLKSQMKEMSLSIQKFKI
jgi:methyl-accepting chemotaxis protein